MQIHAFDQFPRNSHWISLLIACLRIEQKNRVDDGPWEKKTMLRRWNALSKFNYDTRRIVCNERRTTEEEGGEKVKGENRVISGRCQGNEMQNYRNNGLSIRVDLLFGCKVVGDLGTLVSTPSSHLAAGIARSRPSRGESSTTTRASKG